MPEGIICVSNEIKALLVAEIENADIKEELKKAVQQSLEQIETCDEDIPVDFGDISQVSSSERTPKRKKTAYNLFVGECMQRHNVKSLADAPDAMRKCAAEWKADKESLTGKYEPVAE